MKLKKLIKSLKILFPPKRLVDFEVKGISCNSKQVGEGFIFVAINGAREDGRKYINEALNRGAQAILLEFSKKKSPSFNMNAPVIKARDVRLALAQLAAEFYGHPSSKMKIIGITGTNGKTTISFLLEAIFKSAKHNPAVIGTVNYRFNNLILPSKNTTPGPLELQSLLARMHKANIDSVVCEVSSHALDQRRVEGINFASAIFTNLTQDHLDYHKTLKNYFLAKARIFEGLNKKSFAVINNDDRYGARLKKMTKARIVTYGIVKRADFMAVDIRPNLKATDFRLVISGKDLGEFSTPLIGRHNIYNILAAIALASSFRIPLKIIKKVIKEFSAVPGRLERIDVASGLNIFVDYAHTEDALHNVINGIRQISLPDQRIIVVFGCGGERDKTKRPKMGKIVSFLADYAIITNDNPRSEDPREIVRQITKGMRRNNYCVIADRRDAIYTSLTMARNNDIVLVAGKGHETSQILRDKVIHFDDREVVREICLQLKN